VWVRPFKADHLWVSPFRADHQSTIFIDLETTGLSGGAGTVAFLVGCGYFDLGAFQVRQFLLTSFASERALLAAVAEFFDAADLIVTYNGKTFDVPVMETGGCYIACRCRSATCHSPCAPRSASGGRAPG
jgi:uncharacterized protein YprB with RNaseH-like and TPR domain